MRVRVLKTCFVLLLTLVWAAAANHCKLEQIPGLSFLSCCTHEESGPHEDDDCQKDSCATVETQLYKAERTQNSAPAPDLLIPQFLNTLLVELAQPQPTLCVLPDAAPSFLPRVWQFSYRTALPPRAPSILS